jgi:hypothetical protein
MKMTIVLAIVTVASAFANSAIQTDWSGGPGVTGPVTDWADRFNTYTGLDFSSPGVLQLAWRTLETVISDEFAAPISICTADIDGDGDTDVAVTSSNDACNVVWLENMDPTGKSWTVHPVADGYLSATSICPFDADGDGDPDMAAAVKLGAFSDGIRVFLNDGTGASWTVVQVDNLYGCGSVSTGDVDGDGDADIMASSGKEDELWWFANDGTGTSWDGQRFGTGYDGAWCIAAADMGGDGDADAFVACRDMNVVCWIENLDGAGGDWTEHPISTDFGRALRVCAVDIDADGDLDVMASSDNTQTLCCWENADGAGTEWNQSLIASGVHCYSIFPEDMNDDHYSDILVADQIAGRVAWFENNGADWEQHLVDGSFDGASGVCAARVDSGGSMDVLAAAYRDELVSWWNENAMVPSGRLGSSILEVRVDPVWDFLEWTAVTPPGTAVGLQVRVSDDPSAMGDWSDTLYTPCPLAHIVDDGDRYLQYRVILTSTVPDVTPVLDEVMVTWDPMGTGGGPVTTALLPFSPNPCGSPAARIVLTEPGYVELSVFDLSGRLAARFGGELCAGPHDVVLGDLSPGIYFCRMVSEDYEQTERFAVLSSE